MGSSFETIDIATSARRIGVDNRISLKFYFRIADNILKQVSSSYLTLNFDLSRYLCLGDSCLA
jgi:hypothetical protein